MNSREYFERVAGIKARTVPGTLRAAVHAREGVMVAEDAIARGLRAWAIERRPAPGTSGSWREMTVVFGRSRSDALRRAAAPSRLGREICTERTLAVEITSGWDEPLVWPDFPAVTS